MRRIATVLIASALVFLAAGCRTIPDPQYGLTFWDNGDATTATLNAEAAMIAALPHQSTVRVTIDPATAPADYAATFAKLQPIAYTMAEIADSNELDCKPADDGACLTPAQYDTKLDTFLTAFAGPTDDSTSETDPVDIWEVGNESNGNWVPQTTSIDDVKYGLGQVFGVHHKRAALTLFENTWTQPGGTWNTNTNSCDPGEDTPSEWSQHLTSDERDEVSDLYLSWYPQECFGYGLDDGQYNAPIGQIVGEVNAMAALYPNAKIGIGECCVINPVPDTDPATFTTVATAQHMAAYYYGITAGVYAYAPAYTGGVFWWNAQQDMIPANSSKPMFGSISAAMS